MTCARKKICQNPYNDPIYFTEKRAQFPLIKVLPLLSQKHGSRVRFVLNKLVESNMLFKKPFSKFFTNSHQTIHWLDAGAGAAPIARLINRRYKKIIDITSLDITDTGFNLIPKNEKENLKLVKANIFNIPFPDNSFDVISIYDVLEHLKQPTKAMKECIRVLKSGGFLHIVTPNPYPKFIKNKKTKITYQKDPTHIKPPITSVRYFRKKMPNLELINFGVITRGYPETHKYFHLHHKDLFGIKGGNHIYVWGWKK